MTMSLASEEFSSSNSLSLSCRFVFCCIDASSTLLTHNSGEKKKRNFGFSSWKRIYVQRKPQFSRPKLYRGADKSLARRGRKQAAPVKSVMGRGMDLFG